MIIHIAVINGFDDCIENAFASKDMIRLKDKIKEFICINKFIDINESDDFDKIIHDFEDKLGTVVSYYKTELD